MNKHIERFTDGICYIVVTFVLTNIAMALIVVLLKIAIFYFKLFN